MWLTRWLPPAEYGAFAVTSRFPVGLGYYGALLIEPMMVYGLGKYLRVSQTYLGVLLRWHVMFTLVAGASIVGLSPLAGAIYSPSVGHALIALGCSLTVLLLPWLTRRFFTSRSGPARRRLRRRFTASRFSPPFCGSPTSVACPRSAGFWQS